MIASFVDQGIGGLWAPALAFAAGIVSFASPCVLPLVPGYLSFLAGGESGGQDRRRSLLQILLFILGFSVVFTVAGGFTASSAGRWLRSPAGQRLGGAFVVLFGILMVLYAAEARLGWLYREGRPLLSRMRPGTPAAFPLGMAFAIGWTPCIGPVLGAILTLAAAQQSIARSVFLLFVYSLGLGIPFLFLGMGVRRMMGTLRFFSRNYRWFAGAGGVALVTIGVLLMTGAWTRLLSPLLRVVNRFSPPI